MQCLISPVDHESRTNSYNADLEPVPDETEDTPLLHRFPRSREGLNIVSISIISSLMVLLLTGFGIGVYLLVLQNDSENVLPPITDPFQYVPLSQWDKPQLGSSVSFKAKHVIILQTDSRQCWELENCLRLLKDIKASVGPNNSLPYNFLISDGIVYENIGWRTSLEPGLAAVVVAFIGNFTHIPPTMEQINTAKSFFSAAVSDNNLESDFTIIGRSSKEVPKYLFNSLKNLPQWNKPLSDAY